MHAACTAIRIACRHKTVNMLLIFKTLEYKSFGLLAWRIAALARATLKLALTPLNLASRHLVNLQ